VREIQGEISVTGEAVKTGVAAVGEGLQSVGEASKVFFKITEKFKI